MHRVGLKPDLQGHASRRTEAPTYKDMHRVGLKPTYKDMHRVGLKPDLQGQG
jgi:hypothetical protein